MSETRREAGSEIREARSREDQYLTFSLAEEEYGIEILKIKEIIGMAKMEGSVKILLDIERVLVTAEVEGVRQAA